MSKIREEELDSEEGFPRVGHQTFFKRWPDDSDSVLINNLLTNAFWKNFFF